MIEHNQSQPIVHTVINHNQSQSIVHTAINHNQSQTIVHTVTNHNQSQSIVHTVINHNQSRSIVHTVINHNQSRSICPDIPTTQTPAPTVIGPSPILISIILIPVKRYRKCSYEHRIYLYCPNLTNGYVVLSVIYYQNYWD